MTDQLGDLKKLDVRSIWANEASDFTPWLAEEANIDRLGAAIGMELEVLSTEVAAGPYAADILARDSGSSAYVVIENQLGKTDHDHLGKAITYAAVLDAGTIVWVAPEFTPEHRKAIDWLNDKSGGDVSFYGVQVELWQIEQSKPAVRFNVLVEPAVSPLKAALSRTTGPLTGAKKLQLEWWTAFRDALVNSKTVPTAQTPGPRYWFNVALGRSGIHLSNIADTYAGRIGVRIYMRNKFNAEAAFAQLVDQKKSIESEIGHPLVWNPNPDTMDKVIAIYRDVDLEDRSRWPEHIDWMVSMTSKFMTAFRQRVRQLNLDEDIEPSNESDE